jgi:hypothetical protein
MTLEDLPQTCAFCGTAREAARGFHICVAVDAAGKQTRGALCGDCIRLFVIEMAHLDRSKFEALVEEARNWKPGEP